MSATHQTPAPMTEGEAGFGAGQTPASPTVPLGEAGPHSSDADAVGAPASEEASEHVLCETWQEVTGKFAFGWTCSCGTKKGGFPARWTASAAHQMHADSHAMGEWLADHETKGSELVAEHWRNSQWSKVPMVAAAASKPEWMPVAEPTGDLLDLIAEQNPATPQERDEWVFFINILHGFSQPTGFIDQNNVREELRGKVKANRVGAFYRRAMLEGLIEPAGWVVSNDTAGKNSGRPCRMYRWLGAAS